MKAKPLKQHYNFFYSFNEQKVKVLLIVFIVCVFSFFAIFAFSKINKLALFSVVQTPQPYCNLQAAEPKAKKLSREQIDKYMLCSPVTMYFKDTATDRQITSLKAQVEKLQGVYYVEYVSKEAAFISYKEMNKNNPLVLEVMPGVSSFPRSLIVYVREPNLRNSVVKLVQNSSFVETYTAPYLNFKK